MNARFYWTCDDNEKALDEYVKFRKCLPQLIDSDDPITGDLTGYWIIFKDGWVHGLSRYESRDLALDFGKAIFRDEPDAVWIVTLVDLDLHGVSPLELLAGTISELEAKEDPAGA